MWLPLRWLQPQRMVSQMFADREKLRGRFDRKLQSLYTPRKVGYINFAVFYVKVLVNLCHVEPLKWGTVCCTAISMLVKH